MKGAPLADGLLPVDKPMGLTSHDVVASARRALGLRRIGHTGTLDPFASGLLLLLLGTTTRLAEYFDGFAKEYRATARLGICTTTDDREGEVVAVSDAWVDLEPAVIEETMASFRREIVQVPPAYSAKKVGGRPAHRRVRAGETVELAAVSVTIHEIVIEELALPDVRFRVRCSTGTYVRALARDLGERLGVGAHLVELRRLAIGPFRIEEALPYDLLGDAARVAEAWLPPLGALAHLTRIDVGDEEAGKLAMGQALAAGEYGVPEEAGPIAVARGDALVAVAERDGDLIRPKKVFIA
ncbi:MAG: tRNA pseudouridine(55) synthase TruB [Gemmatimonadota bacterium]